MSQSKFITVYFRHENDKDEFYRDIENAKKIFKELWIKEGTGFDNFGNIEGLERYYENCDWDDDAETLKNEKGNMGILNLSASDNDKSYISFSFHNYGAETKISEKIDLGDIYLLFAEILSSCFGHVVKVSDTYDEKEHTVFFDEDGKKYAVTEDRKDYICAIKDKMNSLENIKKSQDKLVGSDKIIKEYAEKSSVGNKRKVD